MDMIFTCKAKMKQFFLFLFFTVGFLGSYAQTTITTNFTNNNGNALITFNFTNNNAYAVVLTNIKSYATSAGTGVGSIFYKTSAINGLPGAISAANGWTLAGTNNFNATSPTTPVDIALNANIIIPANGTYGIAVQALTSGGAADLAYSTITAGTYTFTGGNCILTTGTNIGYGGVVAPGAPTFTPRGFIGSVTFVQATPCSGTPVAGAAVASVPSICAATTLTLSKNPADAPGTSGLQYQWQSSPTLTGTFTNITGATSASYVTTQTAATAYRVVTTCSNGGGSSTSTAVLVNQNPSSSCYCTPANSDCTDGDIITNVKLNTLNNTSSCSAPTGYTNYSTNASINVPEVFIGANNPISVLAGDGLFTEHVGVWVDFNRNGNFEASEFTSMTGISGTPYTGAINVPSTVTSGTTRMRVRVRFSTALTPTDACTGYAYGETEDYTVNLVPCIPIAITTHPQNVSQSCGSSATFSVVADGSLKTYQWQFRSSATAAWTNIINNTTYSGSNTSALTVSNVSSSFTGYQYRAIVSTVCGNTDFSNPATLTVTQLQMGVQPAAANYCNGGTSVAIGLPASTTTSFALNGVPATIPDANLDGVNRTFSVAGITGAIIQASVTLNLTHTWVGDLVIVLKAPNGQVLNIDYYLSATGGAGVTTGFTNTIISSAGITALSSGSSPYSATFKADAQLTPINGFPTAGPTGYTPSTNMWSNLYSIPNGTWTLAVYDGGSGDIGTISSASLNITYGIPSGTTFSVAAPVTGLFTDAAGTIPYTAGTAVTQLYAAPTSTTTYTATVVTPTCTAAPSQFTVTNVQAPTGTATVANMTACAGTDVQFAITGLTGGSGVTYQWQRSIDNGTTWTNISGSTASTLSLTSVNTNMNGNKYRVVIGGGSCAGFPITSSAATLSVYPAAIAVISASPSNRVRPTVNSVLTAAVSPNAPQAYQWYLNGTAITAATAKTQTATTNTTGTYYAIVTDVNGCKSQSNSIIVSDTSDGGGKLYIYPNPNKGKFWIRTYSSVANPQSPASISVVVYDSKGSQVYNKTYSQTSMYQPMEINLSAYGAGIYRIDVVDGNGNRINTGSVLIQ